jgi:hypothetical protein
MSVTNKKLDALRRLLLGSLYDECKSNPMGVSRERLESHLQKIKDEGCIGECTLDEFVKTCQLNNHYPTCITGEYRGCVEGIGEKSRGVEKVYYDQYKRSKLIEDEPDDEDEEEEGETCNVCYLTGDDDIGLPVQEMSCGHHSHVNCLIKIAQQKGRDNAECPECRREFPLTEVPVPVRTLQQRQADSQRRYEFNASQMGLGVDEDEEQSEEDRLSYSIVQNISEHQIDEAIEEIRDFYTRDIRRTILSRYIKAWLIKIKREITIGQMSFDDIKRLIDVIFETNAIISLNNRLIVEFYWLYGEEDNEETKEKIMYVIKAIIKYYIRDDDMFSYFLQILMAENLFMFLEEVMRIVEREGVNDRLRDAFNLALEDINFDRINDETRELIKGWFTRNNYEAPSFETEYISDSMSESIVNYIREHDIDETVDAIQEFYERQFEDTSTYRKDWFIALLSEINIGQIGTDDVKRIVDVIVDGDITSIDREIIKYINNIRRRGTTSQKEQALYILQKVVQVLIEQHPEEEAFGLLIDDLITRKSYDLLRELIKVVDEKNKIDLFNRNIIAIINFNGILDETIRNIISEWFRTHNLEVPSFEPEPYSGESEEEDD